MEVERVVGGSPVERPVGEGGAGAVVLVGVSAAGVRQLDVLRPGIRGL